MNSLGILIAYELLEHEKVDLKHLMCSFRVAIVKGVYGKRLFHRLYCYRAKKPLQTLKIEETRKILDRHRYITLSKKFISGV